MKLHVILWFACAALLSAAVDLNKPIAELKLKDGRALKNVQIVAFASSAVTAKWDGGRGTIAYDLFPAEYGEILADRRAKATLPPPPTAQMSLEAAAKAEAAKLARAKAGAESQAKQDA